MVRVAASTAARRAASRGWVARARATSESAGGCGARPARSADGSIEGTVTESPGARFRSAFTAASAAMRSLSNANSSDLRRSRASMLEVLSREFIRTAEAKGLSQRAVILRHALRNALLPIVTVVGLQIGHLLAGAILTETIFSWPGIGLWVYESLEARDYAIVQGTSLFIAVIVVVVNLTTDLLYALVDPPIRYD